MWFGSFLSNMGTWMQQVVMGSLVFKLTESTGRPSTYVAIVYFAYFLPMLAFAMIAGVVADRFDRRRWLCMLQFEQGVASLALAIAVWTHARPSVWLLAAISLCVGTGNAFNAPAWVSTMPLLVDRVDLPGALSLNSTMINATRVFGPVLGGFLYPVFGAGVVFFLNALTYGFVIAAIVSIKIPTITPADGSLKDRFLGGLAVARTDPVVGRCLRFVWMFSLLCLPILGLFAPIAERQLHLNSKSAAYGWLYAAFGFGAAVGSLALGTVFTRADKTKMVRPGLVGFAVTLLGFSVTRSLPLAIPAVFVFGVFYFGTATSVMTVLQTRLADNVRGRVMALWFMGFGGTVPLSALLYGPLLDRTNSTLVLGISAACALGLALWIDLPGTSNRATVGARR